MQSNFETRTIIQSYVDITSDLSLSAHYELFSSRGWALRTRKPTNPMSEKVKNIVEQLWQETIQTNSKIKPENIQESIRSQRDNSGAKLFQTHEYPTKSQLQYRLRKLNDEYGITVKQQLIEDILADNIE